MKKLVTIILLMSFIVIMPSCAPEPSLPYLIYHGKINTITETGVIDKSAVITTNDGSLFIPSSAHFTTVDDTGRQSNGYSNITSEKDYWVYERVIGANHHITISTQKVRNFDNNMH